MGHRELVIRLGVVALAGSAALPTSALPARALAGSPLPAAARAAVDPPGIRPYVPAGRAAVPEDLDAGAAGTARTPGLLVRDVVASAGQPRGPLFSAGATEPAIAVDPADPSRLAVTAFYDAWYFGNRNASLFASADGGWSWSREDTIPPGPGVTGQADFGPCDQTVDYGRRHRLVGTFVVCGPRGNFVITGSTTDPARASAWHWCAEDSPGCPVGPAPGTVVDQPQVVVGRDPASPGQDDVYLGYSRFRLRGGQPAQARVAVSYGEDPVAFALDRLAGNARPLVTNPGLRLGRDRLTGAVYVVYERSATTGPIPAKIVTYMLNRSTDAGRTWSLNGRPDGIPIATVLSEQSPAYRFCGVNALLGGVTAVGVDPRTGDVYVAYGADTAGTGGNRILLARVTGARAGFARVGRGTPVSPAPNSALPSVAVTDGGTVGVLFDTCEGVSGTGYPRFTARLATSTDRGRSFATTVLSRFLSPEKPVPDFRRQRVLGDYQQLKSAGDALYGVFSGNRAAFGGAVSTIDPVFFRRR